MSDTSTNHPLPASGVQIDAVQDLLSQIIDARAGFDTMVDRAEPEFRAVALKFRETHHQHAERTSAIIVALGGEPNEEGSFFSTVNKTVVSIRALFDGIDEDVMDNVRDGEKHVMDAFDEAIAAMGDDRHREELVAMRKELETLLQETAHLD